MWFGFLIVGAGLLGSTLALVKSNQAIQDKSPLLGLLYLGFGIGFITSAMWKLSTLIN